MNEKQIPNFDETILALEQIFRDLGYSKLFWPNLAKKDEIESKN